MKQAALVFKEFVSRGCEDQEQIKIQASNYKDFFLNKSDERIEEIFSKVITDDLDYRNNLKTASEIEKQLLKEIPEKYKNLINQYFEIYSERQSICESVIYKYGFKDCMSILKTMLID